MMSTSTLPAPPCRLPSPQSVEVEPALYAVSFDCVPADNHPIQWAIKRFFDVAAAVVGGLFVLPVLLVIALIIKLESPGPVFFQQTRIGWHGKRFGMLKFRSMYIDAEARLHSLLDHNETNDCMFKMANDPRVTRIGRFIRKFSLDEFPQLINVIRGEMSLVGPRPPIERELAGYQPEYYVRFSTVPGLTGPWQVGGRSAITQFDQVIELEKRYIHHWSLWQDVVILLKTIPAVLLGHSA